MVILRTAVQIWQPQESWAGWRQAGGGLEPQENLWRVAWRQACRGEAGGDLERAGGDLEMGGWRQPGDGQQATWRGEVGGELEGGGWRRPGLEEPTWRGVAEATWRGEAHATV